MLYLKQSFTQKNIILGKRIRGDNIDNERKSDNINFDENEKSFYRTMNEEANETNWENCWIVETITRSISHNPRNGATHSTGW